MVPLVAFMATVVLPVITCVMAIDVLFAFCESPLYTAVIVWAPTASDDVCKVAVLLLTGTGDPMAVEPSKKVTLPVGLLVSALSVAVNVILLPDAALMLLEEMASSVSFGEPDPPQPTGKIIASRIIHNMERRRARGTHSSISTARLAPPSSPTVRAEVDCAEGDGAGTAMVTVAVCPEPRVTLEGAMEHDDPTGTPLPQVSETVPV